MTDSPRYEIRDNGGVAGYHPIRVFGDYASRGRAQGRTDRLNLEYGAHRFSVRVKAQEPVTAR